MAEKILMNEFRILSKEKWVCVELDHDNVFTWNIALLVLNPDSLYHGGYFKARMSFPKNYPYSPPDFKFNRPLYHPNIYKDGKLCISILHAPGDDEMSGESSGERWSPVQRVESVLLSIVSLLDDAECSSPANVDAGVTLRKDPARYRALVAADVAASKQDIPAGFQMPTGLEKPPPAVEKHDDSDFWCESEQEDFGGSDTDEEMTQDEAEDEREDEDEDEEEEDEEMTEKYDVHEEEEEL